MLDTSDPVTSDCVRFSFIDLLRHDLNRTKEDWDSHIASKSRNWGPSRKPSCMYNLPARYWFGGTTKLSSFFVADYSTEFQEFAEYLMKEDGLEPPSNPTEALNLYTYLLQKIEEYS